MLDRAIEQMRDYGLLVEDPVIGELKRCDVDGDRRGSLNGWYTLFSMRLDNGTDIVTGAYGSWKRGDSQKIWTKGLGLTEEERKRVTERIKENKRLADEARKKAARKAGYVATRVWNKLPQLGESEYLKSKQVKPHRVRYGRGGSLVLPLMDIDGRIHGLQFIHTDPETKSNNKVFWPQGNRVEGHFFLIGKAMRGKPIYFAEGYATAASIHECLNVPVVVVFNSGNLVPVARALLGAFPDSPHVYCADDDWKTTDQKNEPINPGLKAAKSAADVSKGMVVMPVFKERRDVDVDFNDLHVSEGADALIACFQEVKEEISNWRHSLSRSLNGMYKVDTRNVYLVLTNDPAWDGVIKFSQSSYTILKVNKPPYENDNNTSVNNEWQDADTYRTDVWLSQNYGMSVRANVIDAAVDLVAKDNAFHPVKEYLESVEWDKKVRLEFWTSIYLGTPIDPYHMAVSMKFMISAVARVMEYPCKADCVLILEGPQGAGKSTVLDILGGEFYSDTHFALGEKDGYQQIQGVWICELGELDSFNKADTTRAKGFFTSQSDRYRPAYGKRVVEFPRQCVFAGSTNQDSYLKDSTGNRRYWPVRCENIDLDALRRDRDQLWAEAVNRYRQGVKWYVTPEEVPIFESEQELRHVPDSWEEIIADWLDWPDNKLQDQFSTGDILMGAIRMEAYAINRGHETRVGTILQDLGWKKKRSRKDGGRIYKFVRPKPDAPLGDES